MLLSLAHILYTEYYGRENALKQSRLFYFNLEALCRQRCLRYIFTIRLRFYNNELFCHFLNLRCHEPYHRRSLSKNIPFLRTVN